VRSSRTGRRSCRRENKSQHYNEQERHEVQKQKNELVQNFQKEKANLYLQFDKEKTNFHQQIQREKIHLQKEHSAVLAEKARLRQQPPANVVYLPQQQAQAQPAHMQAAQQRPLQVQQPPIHLQPRHPFAPTCAMQPLTTCINVKQNGAQNTEEKRVKKTVAAGGGGVVDKMAQVFNAGLQIFSSNNEDEVSDDE